MSWPTWSGSIAPTCVSSAACASLACRARRPSARCSSSASRRRCGSRSSVCVPGPLSARPSTSWPWGAPAPGTPSPQTTPLGLTVLADETVEIVDPTHPLYGLTLPLLGVTTKQRTGQACVVWLAPSVERIVPYAATSLAGVVPPPSPCRLAILSVRRLIAVIASLPECDLEDAHGYGPAAP